MNRSPGRDSPILHLAGNEMIQLKKELTHPSEERVYEKRYHGEKYLAHAPKPDKMVRIHEKDRWEQPKLSMADDREY